MMKTNIRYRTTGTCSREIGVRLSPDGVIEEVEFVGGCSGNTQGLSRLLVGMNARDAIARLRGVRCGFRSTSCPDQLAQALERCLGDD